MTVAPRGSRRAPAPGRRHSPNAGVRMVRRLVIPLAMALLATPASAQSRDFLFSHPRVSLGVRLGMAAPTAASEIFDFTSEEFWRRGTVTPIERSDFNAFS